MTWKSRAIKVGFDRDRFESFCDQRCKTAHLYTAWHAHFGTEGCHDDTVPIDQELAQCIGVAGELAVERILGGKARPRPSRKPDIIFDDGRMVEVKTAFNRYPFPDASNPPAANIKRRQDREGEPDFPDADIVLCVADKRRADRFVWVAGLIKRSELQFRAQPTKWGWYVPWVPQMAEDLHAYITKWGTPEIRKHLAGGRIQ